MSEHRIMSEVRLALAGRGVWFRGNVGRAWVGEVVSHEGGRLVLANARPFNTGLPVGFSDLFGIAPGGRFAALEVKAPGGRTTEAQERFLAAVAANGGLSGIVRSVDDALALLAKNKPQA